MAGLEPRERSYDEECSSAALPATPTAVHPLQAASAAVAAAEASREEQPAAAAQGAAEALPLVGASDPLSAALLSADFDPLGASGGGRPARGGAVDHNPIGVTDRAPRARDPRRGALHALALGMHARSGA
jgi:hypothetical protein